MGVVISAGSFNVRPYSAHSYRCIIPYENQLYINHFQPFAPSPTTFTMCNAIEKNLIAYACIYFALNIVKMVRMLKDYGNLLAT